MEGEGWAPVAVEVWGRGALPFAAAAEALEQLSRGLRSPAVAAAIVPCRVQLGGRMRVPLGREWRQEEGVHAA
jgi:hypothetical protein